MKTQKIKMSHIRGCITEQKVDAIVNAANSNLEPGGGVCGVIFKKAGVELLAELSQHYTCAPGHVIATPSFRIKTCKYILHTVGPIYHDQSHYEEDLLASCYANAIQLADTFFCQSIAFPCISTGTYGFPKDLAAMIATETVANLSTRHLEQVVFCTFTDEDETLYTSILRNHRPNTSY